MRDEEVRERAAGEGGRGFERRGRERTWRQEEMRGRGRGRNGGEKGGDDINPTKFERAMYISESSRVGKAVRTYIYTALPEGRGARPWHMLIARTLFTPKNLGEHRLLKSNDAHGDRKSKKCTLLLLDKWSRQ